MRMLFKVPVGKNARNKCNDEHNDKFILRKVCYEILNNEVREHITILFLFQNSIGL